MCVRESSVALRMSALRLERHSHVPSKERIEFLTPESRQYRDEPPVIGPVRKQVPSATQTPVIDHV